MSSGVDVNKNVNSQINLSYVGAFHPNLKNIKTYNHQITDNVVR